MATHTPDAKMATAIVPEDRVEFAIKEGLADDAALQFTPAQEKRIVRKIDLRLAVTLGALYCISLLDRTNLGSASIAGYAWTLLLPQLLPLIVR